MIVLSRSSRWSPTSRCSHGSRARGRIRLGHGRRSNPDSRTEPRYEPLLVDLVRRVGEFAPADAEQNIGRRGAVRLYGPEQLGQREVSRHLARRSISSRSRSSNVPRPGRGVAVRPGPLDLGRERLDDERVHAGALHAATTSASAASSSVRRSVHCRDVTASRSHTAQGVIRAPSLRRAPSTRSGRGASVSVGQPSAVSRTASPADASVRARDPRPRRQGAGALDRGR